MAQKKFSRLSIMLEARDKMTKPMQSAAKASQHLQGSVSKLGSSLSRNSQGYQKYAESVKLASNSTNSFAHTLGRAVKESALAHVANKTLSASYKLLKNGVQGTGFAIKEASISLGKFISRTASFTYISQSLKMFRNEVKFTGDMFKYAIKNTKLWQFAARQLFGHMLRFRAAKILIKDTAESLKLATAATIKNSRAYKLMSGALLGVKKNIVATTLAFKLWKNSSVFLPKVKNDIINAGKAFSWLGNSVKKLIPTFKTLRNNIQNVGNSFGKLQGRRSTFNQLADSNAKLNKQLVKMNAELSKSNSKLGKMKSHLGSINAVGLGFSAAYAGQAGFHSGGRILEGTVGKAMEQQFSQKSVGILAGKDNAEKFYRQIQEYAATTAYAPEEWAMSMRGAIAKSKNVKDLETFQLAIEQLATLDPVQGLEGAALAIRELNSGDSKSLVERFELPRKSLDSVRKMKDPLKQIEALMKVVGETTGFTVDAIQQMKQLPLMQWKKMTNLIKTAMGYIGAGALEKVAPLFERFNKAWDAGKFEPVIKIMSDGLTRVTEKALSFASEFSTHIADAKQKFEPFTNLLSNMKDTVVEGFPKVAEIFDNVRWMAGNLADEVSNRWPEINSVIQTVLDKAKEFSDWLVIHWEDAKEKAIALGAAILTYKALMSVVPIWTALVKAVKLYREGTLLATAAQWLWNVALNANPIGLVILAISALVGIGVLLYQNWETIRAKTGELWDKLGAFKGVAMVMLGPLALIIRAAVTMAEQWDSTKSVWENVWNGIKLTAQNVTNEIIDSINKLIEMLNKIPGVKIPVIPQVDWTSADAAIKKGKEYTTNATTSSKSQGSFHGGLNYVPYDGYTARLHKGEQVLTASEAKQNRNGNDKAVTITGNNFYVREESDIDKIADALFRKLNETKVAMG